MKKLIIIPLIAFISLSTNAQTYKFKAFQFQYEDKETPFDKDNWKEINTLIALNTDRQKLFIFSKKEIDYDIIFKSSEKDENGDRWLYYKGVDEDGLRSNISLVIYKDQTGKHNATLIIAYKDIEYYYRLETDD